MKPAVRAVALAASALEWALATWAGLMMFALLGASAMGVYDRYVQQLSWGAFDQWARMALLGLVFSALPVAIRRGEAIRLHLLESRLGPVGRRRLHAVFDACVIGVCLVYLSTARPMIQVGSAQGVMGTPLDYGAVYAAAMVCFAAIALFRAEALVQRWNSPLEEQ
ncbi:TRAP transporter small permease [Ramlibacter sp.]|uniref:TRAP transporter small permease n=1 Tax=Ramlibacter sp. TaxID=1917967 RepID=UPI003D12D154